MGETGRVQARWGASPTTTIYSKAVMPEFGIDTMMARHGGARLVKWLAARPSAWAGWPTFIALEAKDVQERQRRLRAAGWPDAVPLRTAELRQVDVAVAHLRARRRLALVGACRQVAP